MGSRPPLRRAPSRSPPPSSSTPTPPSSSTGTATSTGKIIRLPNRFGDSPIPSRADVTARPSSSAPRPPLIRKRPSPPPSSSAPLRPSAPSVWKRRPPPPPPESRPNDRSVPVPMPQSDPIEEVRPDPKPSVPEHHQEKPPLEMEADPVEDEPEAGDISTPHAETGTETEMEKPVDVEPDELDLALEAIVSEGTKLMQATTESIGEKLRCTTEDLKTAIAVGDPALVARIGRMIYKNVVEPAEEHLRVMSEIAVGVEAELERLKKELEEEEDSSNISEFNTSEADMTLEADATSIPSSIQPEPELDIPELPADEPPS